MDIGAIFKGLLGRKKAGGGASSGGKQRGKAKKSAVSGKAAGGAKALPKGLLLAAAAVLVAAGYVKFYYLPHHKTLGEQQEKLQKIHDMQAQLVTMKTQKETLTKKLTDSGKHYKEVLGWFGDTGNLEELYNSISSIAMADSLTVLTIKAAEGKAAEGAATSKSAVTEKTANVELQGKYPDFLRFREKLAQEKPMLGIKAETIELNTGGKGQSVPGVITIKMTVTDYAIDKKPIEEALAYGQ